jgi:hypothetical protein
MLVLDGRFLVFQTNIVEASIIAGYLPAPFNFSQAYLPHFAAITNA